ncbi:ATP-binding protein [Costertonia aggregata]|uniref:histidine kinase n=1 Tax=Costertonia aggregata TaxID=343403 RepID=A0A7H9ANY5_9FLAO|nr:ATP-binding protein [Costertonia aggregata]QLG44975.1 PAS domain S-box protein [Costertonia aggregata]
MIKPSKYFIVLLILATALLAFIGSRSYKQIQELRESADMVAHTLRVEAEINHLFSQFAMMQSEVFEARLRNETKTPNVLRIKKDSVDAIVKRLRRLTSDNPQQQRYLQQVDTQQAKLYSALRLFKAYVPNTVEAPEYGEALNTVSTVMDSLETVKAAMLNTEEELLRQRQVAYQKSYYFTPFMTLFLGMFALAIFLFSFLRINRERKQTKRANDFVQNVLKSSPNIVSHFEPVLNEKKEVVDFKFLFTSEQIEGITNDSQNEIIGTNLTHSFPEVLENGLFELMKTCLVTGETQTHEALYDFDGEKMWFTNTINKLGNGVTNTARDTTKEKNAEAKLKAFNERLEEQNLTLLDSRGFLNNIFKSISSVVMNLASVRDEKGKIVDFEILFMNDAINEVTGDIPETIKHKKASEIFPTIFTSGVFEKLVACIEENRQMEYETSYEKDGHTLWFQATAIKLNDGVTVTTRDITEEKRKSEELVSLNEQLAIQNSIFKDAEEVANIGSYVGYLRENQAWISDNFYRILGHEPHDFEITFEKFKEFVHPDDLEIYEQIRNETLGLGTADSHRHRIITKGGTIKHLHVNGQMIIKDGNQISVGVVRDVTKEVKSERRLKSKNEELKRSNAELESFNRVASHDLQEPMRKIQMFISRISDSELERLSEKGRMYFDKINGSANRMQTLIKYLLAYSRINKNQKEFVPVDLNETVAKVLGDLDERISESDVEIAVDELPTLKGIPFQIEQLLNNLISNAIKYRSTTEKSKIVIDCKKLSRSRITDEFDKKKKYYYRLSIMDNGIGFAQENAEKIFELFERLHQRNEYSGTGIGLAICKKIAENHNGHIVAESEKGKGATFCVYLPA